MNATKASWYVQAGKLVAKLQKILDSVGSESATTRKKALKTKVKTKVAASSVTSGEGRRGRKVDPNSKSQLVKTYFEKNGFDHPLKEVVDALAKQHGQPFTVGLVANVKHRLGGTTHREKTAKVEKTVRAKKIEKMKGKKVATPKEPSKRGQTLWDVLNSILSKNSDGLKLGEITNLVKKSGYEYRGGKDLSGLKQNVWQCLNKMKKEGAHKGYEGTEPVVIHDSGKKYHINPKATRKVA
jgi:hypothetical protein